MIFYFIKIVLSISIVCLLVSYIKHEQKKDTCDRYQDRHFLNTIDIPKKFNLEHKDVLFFDIFYKKDKLYLISPIYNSPYKESDIKVIVDNKELVLTDKKVKNEYEPTLIFMYDYKSNKKNIRVSVTYRNQTEEYELSDIKPTKKFLTLTTLFKDDYRLFPIFYEYYKKQGVDHFYMYYNGVITDEINKIVNIRDVTLIVWDFRYWNWKRGHKYEHHAQLGQLHHAIYKYGKDISDYMIFCDLDEYLHIPGKTLKEYILKNKTVDIFGFSNYWSKLINTDTFPTTFPTTFLHSDKNEYPHQGKNILKIKNIETIGIHDHHVFNHPNPVLKTDSHMMFHFYHWCNYDNHRPERNNIMYTHRAHIH